MKLLKIQSNTAEHFASLRTSELCAKIDDLINICRGGSEISSAHNWYN